ncbi:hypothetical protein T09_15480 [Trichinella sp. T9]|nr:hypothetical protein T09_15480 [Trichinella sp. T9]
MEVGSVHVDRVNHFYDFTCEGAIQILPSCHWFLFQWLTFHYDAVLCSIAEEQTRLDNSVLGLLSNVEWFVAEPNECGSSKSRATRVGVETIGIGLLSECGTFETHFENRGRIMPSRNNISNALSPQLKDREQGKNLHTRLEEGLTSSNDKERDTYVDGVVNVFTEFLRKPNDHEPCPPPKNRTKEEEKKSRRFEADEVTLHLKLMSAKTSAGLDGVQVLHIRKCDLVCLAKAFNCFLLARYIPPQLKDCRTTLIPKTNNPRPDAEDYRPITIASCIYRLFSKIVTRLSKGIRHSQRLRMLGLDTDSWALIWKMVTGNTTSASNKVEWVLKLALEAAGELLHTFQPRGFQPQKARVNGVCGG